MIISNGPNDQAVCTWRIPQIDHFPAINFHVFADGFPSELHSLASSLFYDVSTYSTLCWVFVAESSASTFPCFVDFVDVTFGAVRSPQTGLDQW